MHLAHNIGIASQIGKYSDAIEVCSPVSNPVRWLYTSGTPGLDKEGNLPNNISAQAELAWSNITSMLTQADMAVGDIVKITHYLTRETDIADYVKVRSRFIGDARPASMLLITPALVKPGFLVEIEIIAAKA
ncbi:RidA family protein [Undibacterium sp. Ji50W]|uniref:RidA family protein n=1 Tax=Undibacterium sp. Ji50W TaxID=3413041 RepID=UPI003BF3AA6F